MTRGEIVKKLRQRGIPARPHHLDWAVRDYKLVPAPAMDGSHRAVYTEDHLEQVAAFVYGIQERKSAREARRAAEEV